MAKIKNDKYYTSKELALYCINKTYEIIGDKNIVDVIEPSAGSGSFSKQIPIGCTAYDIDPDDEDIIKNDFLELDIDYLKGRLIIGNPPYGEKMNLAQKFYKKSINICDYVAFILPISQLNNNISLFEFDLIYSEDLGKQDYSGVKLHCCFNIYKRPESGELNNKSTKKLKDISIIRQDSKKFSETNIYDLRMCYWGASAGRILKYDEHYAAEYKIVIHNEDLKSKIIEVLSNVNWQEELNYIAMPKIQQFHIIKVLQKYITEIK